MATSTATAGGSSSTSRQYASEAQVVTHWNELRGEVARLYERIAEGEMELSEHKLVVDALQGMEPTRRCFRAVGGVLVERTVGEVRPAVQRNAEAIAASLNSLADVLAKKRAEVGELETKYNIRVRRAGQGGPAGQGSAAGEGASGAAGGGAGGSSQGVLVGGSSGR